MNDCMTFPDTVEEFMEQYKVVDTEHIYTNGSEFVPIFRMKQWFGHLPSAQPELKELSEWKADFKGYINALNMPKDDYDGIMEYIDEVPSAQPERKAVFNRDIAIEAICDEVMLWFDISATQAYEIAETAVKRIEVRMEKMEKME